MQTATSKRRYLYPTAAAIALLSFALYIPALKAGFLDWDDGTYVLDNRHIHALNLDFLAWAFSGFHSGNWHPLTWISHALDWAAWGPNALGHHLGNTILHALNSALVAVLTFGLVSVPRAGSPDPGVGRSGKGEALVAAAVAGVLFGVHPIHVESVAWISERKDLLCAFFYILALIVYLKPAWSGPGSQGREIPAPFSATSLLCLALFLLALLSKPMAVSLPVALLLLDWYPLGRIDSLKQAGRSALAKLPFFVLAFASCIITVFAQKSGGAIDTLDQVPLAYRLVLAGKSLFVYLAKLLWPADLVPFYPLPSASVLFSYGTFAALAVVMAITVCCLVAARSNRLWLSLWIFYAVTLLPVSGVVQIGRQAMADRYAYLPGLSLFILAGIAAARCARRWDGGKYLVSALCIVVGIQLGFLTLQQLRVWHDSITFWNCIISKGPSERLAFAFNNRGIAWAGLGDLDKAAADFESAIRANPSEGSYLKNRGILKLKQKRPQEALADFQQAIALSPKDSESYYNVACIYSLENRTAEACDWLRKSIEHGYDNWQDLKGDRDFDNIRSSACYQEITRGR